MSGPNAFGEVKRTEKENSGLEKEGTLDHHGEKVFDSSFVLQIHV